MYLPQLIHPQALANGTEADVILLYHSNMEAATADILMDGTAIMICGASGPKSMELYTEIGSTLILQITSSNASTNLFNIRANCSVNKSPNCITNQNRPAALSLPIELHSSLLLWEKLLLPVDTMASQGEFEPATLCLEGNRLTSDSGLCPRKADKPPLDRSTLFISGRCGVDSFVAEVYYAEQCLFRMATA